jgi:hypothetical protein
MRHSRNRRSSWRKQNRLDGRSNRKGRRNKGQPPPGAGAVDTRRSCVRARDWPARPIVDEGTYSDGMVASASARRPSGRLGAARAKRLRGSIDRAVNCVNAGMVH